ncbi:MAG TPA: hypothetical protein DEA08_05770, partial [Planctomycetes bacterium]|nr:hypothetical protein [Planctomycetota bacterium]
MPAAYLLAHALLALLLAALGLWAGAPTPEGAPPSRRRARFTMLLLGVVMALFLLVRLSPEPVANALPHPDLVFFSDLIPHCALAIALLAARSGASRLARARQALLGCALVAVSLYASELPFLPRELDLGAGRVDRAAPAYPVVRQSTPSTCAAAAAATLLRASGRDPAASEQR